MLLKIFLRNLEKLIHLQKNIGVSGSALFSFPFPKSFRKDKRCGALGGFFFRHLLQQLSKHKFFHAFLLREDGQGHLSIFPQKSFSNELGFLMSFPSAWVSIPPLAFKTCHTLLQQFQSFTSIVLQASHGC